MITTTWFKEQAAQYAVNGRVRINPAAIAARFRIEEHFVWSVIDSLQFSQQIMFKSQHHDGIEYQLLFLDGNKSQPSR